MHPFYKEVVDQLKEIFEKNASIFTVWEGGSAATGFLDDLSDLDLGMIVDDESVENVFDELELYLSKKFGIKSKFRMPEPNWHGHSQCFYILEKSPDYFYIDLLIEKENAGNRFLESNRHGNSIVWFDEKNLVDNTPELPDVYLPKCKRQFDLFYTYLPFAILDLRKQIKRGNFIDAISFYNSLINRLVMMLNILHRPAKFDFGMRYLYRDLPENEVKLVESLFSNLNLDTIRQNLDVIQNKLEEIKPKLEEILEN
jgi:predicted nucleotidyltransferase